MTAFIVIRLADPADPSIFMTMKQRIDRINEAVELGPWYIKHASVGPPVPANSRDRSLWPTRRQHVLFASHRPGKLYSCMSEKMIDPAQMTVVVANPNETASPVTVSSLDDGLSLTKQRAGTESNQIMLVGTGIRTDRLMTTLFPRALPDGSLPRSSLDDAYQDAPVANFDGHDFDRASTTVFRLNTLALDREPSTQVVAGYVWKIGPCILSLGSVKTVRRGIVQESGQTVLVQLNTIPPSQQKQPDVKPTSLAEINVLYSCYERLGFDIGTAVVGSTDTTSADMSADEVRAFCQLLR